MILFNNVLAQGTDHPNCISGVSIIAINPTPSECASTGVIHIYFDGSNVGHLELNDITKQPKLWLEPTDGVSGTIFTGVSISGSGRDRDVPNIAAGIYNVQVNAFCNDANDRTVTGMTATVTVTGAYIAPTFGAAQARKTMNCQPTGQIGLTMSGGVKPYFYSITTAPPAYSGATTFSATSNGTAIIDNLPDGDYIINMRDACGIPNSGYKPLKIEITMFFFCFTDYCHVLIC